MYNMFRFQKLGPNKMLFHTKEYTAFLSYGVPQVIVWKDDSEFSGTVMHNMHFYSNTTGKHKKAFMRTLCTASYTFIPATPGEIREVTNIETPTGGREGETPTSAGKNAIQNQHLTYTRV
jgi:hypothetical protein